MRTTLLLTGMIAAALPAPAAAAAPPPRVAVVRVPTPAAVAALPSAPHGRSAARPAPPARVFAPLRAPFTFDLVGARWRPRGSVTVWARTRTARGAWSPWQRLGATDPAPGERAWHGVVHAEPLWAPHGRLLQLRVTGAGRARRLRAVFVDGSHGPAPRALRAPAATGQPAITTRARWGADEGIRRAPPLYAPAVKVVFVHHTVTANDYGPTASAAIVRSIYAYHVQSNGWNDIGYNFLVDRYGQIFEGRYGGIARNVIGAHTMGFNSGSVGIALIGNGDTAAPTAAQAAALRQLVSWRLDLAHVDPLSHQVLVSGGNPSYPAGRSLGLRAISGHRDAYPTDCPGALVYPTLGPLASAVAATGLPKLYAPTATVSAGAVSFAARLSGPASWTVTVRDRGGSTVGRGAGSGSAVAWSWTPTVPLAGLSWTMDAQDASGATALPASGTLGGTSAPAPPPSPLAAAVSPRSFSPNGDGSDDVATVSYHLAAPALASVSVVDAAGAPVATLTPTSSVPAGDHTVVWNGLGADGVTPVPDGVYHVVVQSLDAAGHALAQTVDVAVARAFAGLALSRPVVSPNGDGRSDRTTLTWRQDEPTHVTATLMHGTTAVATIADGDYQPGPQSLTWDGSTVAGGLRSGRYLVVLRAATAGGDQLAGQSLTVDLTPPRVSGVRIRPSAAGGFVRLRLSEPAYLQIVAGSARVVMPFALHDAGLHGFRFRLAGPPARRFRIVGQDLAGNPLATVRVLLRR